MWQEVQYEQTTASPTLTSCSQPTRPVDIPARLLLLLGLAKRGLSMSMSPRQLHSSRPESQFLYCKTGEIIREWVREPSREGRTQEILRTVVTRPSAASCRGFMEMVGPCQRAADVVKSLAGTSGKGS